jgi:hypothetical protein
MMIAVQIPKETMHHIFVREPGYELHGDEGEKHDENRNQKVHMQETKFR